MNISLIDKKKSVLLFVSYFKLIFEFGVIFCLIFLFLDSFVNEIRYMY